MSTHSTPDPTTHRSLGPSDSSDSGSDVVGADAVPDSDTDRVGTGEGLDAGGTATPGGVDHAPEGTDRIVGIDEAGVARGLDNAEGAEIDPVGGARDDEDDDLDD